MELENDGDTYRILSPLNGPQESVKKMGGTGDQRRNPDPQDDGNVFFLPQLSKNYTF